MKSRAIRLNSENDVFQIAEVIKRNRKKRTRYGEFFLEGVRSLNLLADNRWVLTRIFYNGDTKLSSWASDYIDQSGCREHL